MNSLLWYNAWPEHHTTLVWENRFKWIGKWLLCIRSPDTLETRSDHPWQNLPLAQPHKGPCRRPRTFSSHNMVLPMVLVMQCIFLGQHTMMRSSTCPLRCPLGFPLRCHSGWQGIMRSTHIDLTFEANTLVADPTAPDIKHTVPCSRHTHSFSQQTLSSSPPPCQPVAARKQSDMRFGVLQTDTSA